MPISKKANTQTTVKHKGQEIDAVTKFVYLGSEMKAEGGSESEIRRRIALARSTFSRLLKIFKRHDIKLKIKMRALNTCMIPVLIYGCEPWSITKTMENRLNAAENKWIRRILRISYKDHITNESIRQRTQQPLISDIIKKRRMKWAGHVLRMDENRNPRKIYNYKPDGKRAVGRPKRRWIDCLEEDLKAAGITIYGKTEGRQRTKLEELAKSRDVWSNVIMKSMTGYSQRIIT